MQVRSLGQEDPWNRIWQPTTEATYHTHTHTHTPCIQYSCLENSMDRGGWQVAVHGVKKSWTQLSVHTLPLRHWLP